MLLSIVVVFSVGYFFGRCGNAYHFPCGNDTPPETGCTPFLKIQVFPYFTFTVRDAPGALCCTVYPILSSHDTHQRGSRV